MNSSHDQEMQKDLEEAQAALAEARGNARLRHLNEWTMTNEGESVDLKTLLSRITDESIENFAKAMSYNPKAERK